MNELISIFFRYSIRYPHLYHIMFLYLSELWCLVVCVNMLKEMPLDVVFQIHFFINFVYIQFLNFLFVLVYLCRLLVVVILLFIFNFQNSLNIAFRFLTSIVFYFKTVIQMYRGGFHDLYAPILCSDSFCTYQIQLSLCREEDHPNWSKRMLELICFIRGLHMMPFIYNHQDF